MSMDTLKKIISTQALATLKIVRVTLTVSFSYATTAVV